MAQNLSSAAVVIGTLRDKNTTCIAIFFKSKYDQEMPQSHTADQREEETQNTNSHLTSKGNLSKATSSLFPSEVIANLILKTTLSTTQQNKNQISYLENNSIELWIVMYCYRMLGFRPSGTYTYNACQNVTVGTIILPYVY